MGAIKGALGKISKVSFEIELIEKKNDLRQKEIP